MRTDPSMIRPSSTSTYSKLSEEFERVLTVRRFSCRGYVCLSLSEYFSLLSRQRIIVTMNELHH